MVTDGGANVENAGGMVMHSVGGMKEASSKDTVETASKRMMGAKIADCRRWGKLTP